VALPYTFTGALRTARLTIRALTPADTADVHAYESDADVCRYLPYEPRSRAEVAEKVARWATALTLAGEGDFWQLAIERTGDPGVIGDLYFALKSTASATAEVGWVLHPDHNGQGYMTEAATAVLDLAFTELALHRVTAQLDARNTASAALCRRLGMRQEAHFVEEEWFKGEWSDTVIYAVLAREWAAGHGRAGGRGHG
jgi:RimJ/RimL family protein N-acetyltransferase